MNYKYFPHTPEDINNMLSICGKKSLAELFEDIPQEVRFDKDYNLPSEMSEIEIHRFFHNLASKNKQMTCFAGAGCYDHYSPSVIKHIIERSEFLTSYTPYQAEISQGTLQYIFEYQSLMAELTNMEVSNASMYDGATATAEAMIMAFNSAKKRNIVLVSSTINPAVKKVVETYAHYHGVTIDYISQTEGVTNKAEFEQKVSNDDVAGVIVSSPNYYGIIEDYDGWADTCHAHKSLFIMNCNASSLSVIKTPGELNADIAVGDGQSLGIPMGYGGPYVGYMCTRKSLIRKMPGRVVGMTTDTKGQRSFVLTLQAREQHIRREKATSNICSNQSLMALYVVVYMAIMGEKGLRDVNEISFAGAHYLSDSLCSTGLFSMKYANQPFLNEFAVKTDIDVDKFLDECKKQGILGGVKLDDNSLLMCVTELRTKQEIDSLVEIAKRLNS